MTRSDGDKLVSGIRKRAAEMMDERFHSSLVDSIRSHGNILRSGDTTIVLAKEFGFCYGVDRAVESAFGALLRFPGRKIWIAGEIIHNPRVNNRLREMGVRFLKPVAGGLTEKYADLEEGGVVVIPAFGAVAGERSYLEGRGLEIVDTTCGSVLNVWKRVRQYSGDNFTAVIHGKFNHEETRATCSQVIAENPHGKYLVLLDLDEARIVARQIEHGDFKDFFPRFAPVVSPGFDPERDLGRIGLANQTTMLGSESREIQQVLQVAISRRYGEEDLENRFRAFATICSATEHRQRAVEDLVDDGVDRILVVGGYNSSNTGHLVEIAIKNVPAYHIESAECIVDADTIRAKPLDGPVETIQGWLPPGPVRIGVTGGASTPDSAVGEVIAAVMRIRGMELPG